MDLHHCIITINRLLFSVFLLMIVYTHVKRKGTTFRVHDLIFSGLYNCSVVVAWSTFFLQTIFIFIYIYIYIYIILFISPLNLEIAHLEYSSMTWICVYLCPFIFAFHVFYCPLFTNVTLLRTHTHSHIWIHSPMFSLILPSSSMPWWFIFLSDKEKNSLYWFIEVQSTCSSCNFSKRFKRLDSWILNV